jgi:hypothetical protein
VLLTLGKLQGAQDLSILHGAQVPVKKVGGGPSELPCQVVMQVRCETEINVGKGRREAGGQELLCMSPEVYEAHREAATMQVCEGSL